MREPSMTRLGGDACDDRPLHHGAPAGAGLHRMRPGSGPDWLRPTLLQPVRRRGSPSACIRTNACPPTPVPSHAQPRPAKSADLAAGRAEIFPRYRLVGYAGRDRRLGPWPVGNRPAEPAGRRDRSVGQAVRRRAGDPAGVEVIATVVQGSPGVTASTGCGCGRTDRQVPQGRSQASSRAAAQSPAGSIGVHHRGEGVREVAEEPDVGVALDPEWAMDRGQRPGGVFGHTTGAELDEIAGIWPAWSSATTCRRR